MRKIVAVAVVAAASLVGLAGSVDAQPPAHSKVFRACQVIKVPGFPAKVWCAYKLVPPVNG